MSNPEIATILKKISEIAALAGIRGQIDEQHGHFVAGFNLENGRSQSVRVRPTARTPSGKLVVTVFSPCVEIKSGFWGGFSKDDALELLRHNEKVPFARYGIMSFADGDIVVASVDHILDTLDAEELHTHMWAVAHAADAYEAKHDQDKF